jgi:hypothetical protein
MKTLFQFYLALLIAVAIGCSVPAPGRIADPRIMQQVTTDAREATLVSHRLEKFNTPAASKRTFSCSSGEAYSTHP